MSGWKPREDLLHKAEAAAVWATSALGHAPGDPACLLEALATLGWARTLGLKREVTLAGPYREAIAQLDFEVLEEDAIRLVEAESLESFEEIVAARDRIEHVLVELDHRRVSGIIGRDAEIRLASFEHLLRHELPRLTSANAVRDPVASAIRPDLRRRFWWWCEGAGIDANAYASLTGVAELVARFPVARERFDALARSAGTLERPKVVRFSDWLARRRGAEPMKVAAATSSESVEIARTSAYELAWRPPATIVLDVNEDLAPGVLPTLRTGRRERAMTPVPRTEQRFSITLEDAELDEAQVIVGIPLATGPIDVAVPSES